MGMINMNLSLIVIMYSLQFVFPFDFIRFYAFYYMINK